jgi:competence protein ComFC
LISSGAISFRGWAEAALGFFYPNVCQVCLAEQATPQQGYVGLTCRSRPGAIQMIAPPFCARCGLPFEGEITTPFECHNCRDVELHFRSARSAVVFRGLVSEVIHRYKYQGAVWFEPFLAELFTRQAGPELEGDNWDLIVPVPLHPVKKREREFNQAERLARALGKVTGLPVEGGLLQRTLPTRTQTQLSRSERAANVAKAFTFRSGAQLDGERIVLVDDVFTTGATTNACAKLLRRNGSGEVCVWTVARGL